MNAGAGIRTNRPNRLRLAFPCLILLLLFFSGCGKKGPLLPPVKKIPKTAEAVQVHQKGSKAVFTWRNPVVYIDGSPLDNPGKVEIYAAQSPIEESASGITAAQFKDKSRLMETILQDTMHEYSYSENPSLLYYEYPFELDAINKAVFALAVKIYDGRGKESDFSDPALLVPATVARPPQKLDVRIEPDGVVLTWQQPAENINGTTPPLVQGYNIYKKQEVDIHSRINRTPITGTEYKDTDIEWGRTYSYWVRAAVSDSSVYPESENSESVEVTPEDLFPPEPPDDLTALAGSGFVALSWRESRASDLQGYRIWRRRKRAEKFKVLTQEPIRETSYTDRTAESGIQYQYRVTALDAAGNESSGSDPVTLTVRK